MKNLGTKVFFIVSAVVLMVMALSLYNTMKSSPQIKAKALSELKTEMVAGLAERHGQFMLLGGHSGIKVNDSWDLQLEKDVLAITLPELENVVPSLPLDFDAARKSATENLAEWLMKKTHDTKPPKLKVRFRNDPNPL